VTQGKVEYEYTIPQGTDDGLDLWEANRGWGNIRDNIKTSATKCPGWYELKLQEPWFDEEG